MSRSAMLNRLRKKIAEIESLLKGISCCRDDDERQLFLANLPTVKFYLKKNTWFQRFVNSLPPDKAIAIKSVIALGEGERVFSHFDEKSVVNPPFHSLLETLVEIERFYDTIGGIIGYHYTVIRLIDEEGCTEVSSQKKRYYKPPGVNIMNNYEVVERAVKRAIVELPKLGEIYPVGGAGDRLNLKEKDSGLDLPAALLPFCGRSLLALLIRDVEAKEFLYFKLMGKQLTIPLALMTSQEKENHTFILEICEKEKWFSRPVESFRFFVQPMVPVISKEGCWMMRDKENLWLKPGGHGVIWKKALDDGVMDWFKKSGRTKLLVRQINNPLAATDYGILAFLGLGFEGGRSFGFASCRRVIKAAEGMNVLVENESEKGYSYTISNIEYTEFTKKGVEELPLEEGSRYSAFPANTNILFADIETVEKALESCPIPGMIINMKNSFDTVTPEGKRVVLEGGRLESTMQNIADVIVDTFPKRLQKNKELSLKTYVTYNKRRKTLSVTKNGYEEGKSIEGTPQGGYYDLLQNMHELFVEQCNISLPELPSAMEYMEKGPPFHILFHPALGPCWNIIEQKIYRGKIFEGGELQLEISELHCENLSLKGSLVIEAKNPTGRPEKEGVVVYGDSGGKCELIDVAIDNKGIDRVATTEYWSNDIVRNESLQIVIHGSGEFFASNVTFYGNHFIEVADGYRVVAVEEGGKLTFHEEKIASPTWCWNYSFDKKGEIALTKRKFSEV